jgi:Zn-finger nucleic acid-binding protein
MNCPVCNQVTLVMAERHGIEIDHCPKCRGVWLDRGELDKIIERGAFPASQDPRQPDYGSRDRRDAMYDDDDDDRYPGRGRRRGFLGELFDFD